MTRAEISMLNERAISKRRRGFTVLELLVVVAIVGTLLALLLPALMAAREAARCVQCKSNLREISLAVQHYHDANKKLPGAWTSPSDNTSGYGWAVALLPYLEDAALYRSINLRSPVSAPQNDLARNTDLPLMRCPSDITDPSFDLMVEPPGGRHRGSGADVVKSDSAAPLVRLPSANYVGVFGTLEADETFPAPPGDGPIVFGRTVRFADLQRGQSHTIIVGERTTAMVPSTWFGVHFHGEDAACRLVGSAMTNPNCDTCDECEFGSRHSGGSNFVWGDGHVSLVLNNIDPHEYQALAKRRLQ
jgi:prepilin-type N-terminal cleavage/methylation domain-containing protein/prepilin-type processing-associated H-X9-DG protein